MKYIYITMLFLVSACNNENIPKEQKSTETPKNKITKTDSAFQAELNEANRLISQYPDKAEGYHEKAKVKLKYNRLEGAIGDLKSALMLDTNAAILVTLTNIYVASNLGKSAQDAIDMALRIDPKYAPALFKKGEFQFYKKQYDAAITTINNGLTLDITNPEGYFWKGMVYVEKASYEANGNAKKAMVKKAESSFLTAIEQNPDYEQAYLQLALLNEKENPKVAAQFLKSCLRINAKNTKALYVRALISQNQNLKDSAMADYNRILMINPFDPYSNFNKGYIYLSNNKLDSAYLFFTHAIENDTTYAEAFYNRGFVSEKQGKKQAAKNDYQIANRLNPFFDLPKQGLSRVQ